MSIIEPIPIPTLTLTLTLSNSGLNRPKKISDSGLGTLTSRLVSISTYQRPNRALSILVQLCSCAVSVQ